ncbi:MAG: NAD-dependent epimerase [bacterium]
MNIFVTGSAGFIGFHVTKSLLERGDEVIGLDNINDYYDPSLKKARLEILKENKNYFFYKYDLCDFEKMKEIFKKHSIDKICHLAAQAGVRYSIENPFVYQRSNNEGFLNIIELARHYKVKNFVYASSSSVYGGNKKLPFAEEDRVDNPISLYAATKKSNELTAHVYSQLFNLPCTGLRFFTVYGPWGRPDMALFLFTKSILNDVPINIYNNGDMKRNFTYIDDIVRGVLASLDIINQYEIFNLGNNRTENLMDFIKCIEENIGKTAKKNYLPIQPGDVKETWADLSHAKEILNFEPGTNIKEGVKKFVDWYRKFYGNISSF